MVIVNRISIHTEVILHLNFLFFFSLGLKTLPPQSEMMTEIAKVREAMAKQ